MALRSLVAGMTIPVVGCVMGLTLTFNRGGSFGILASYGQLLLIFVITALAVFAWHFRRLMALHAFYRIGAALIVGGAVGNLIDRIRYGHVIDFLDLHVWPVFNVADSAICLGVALVALRLLSSKKGSKESRDEAPPEVKEPAVAGGASACEGGFSAVVGVSAYECGPSVAGGALADEVGTRQKEG
jgi:signal peptidase II